MLASIVTNLSSDNYNLVIAVKFSYFLSSGNWNAFHVYILQAMKSSSGGSVGPVSIPLTVLASVINSR